MKKYIILIIPLIIIACKQPNEPHTYRIEMTVVCLDSNEPLSGVFNTLYNVDTNNLAADFTAVSDENGRFIINNIPRGIYTHIAEKEGYRKREMSLYLLSESWTTLKSSFQMQPIH